MNGLSELGEPLARGRTAVVHRWGTGRVIKVYEPWVSASAVWAEQRSTAAAAAAGLPAPRVGDVVPLGARIGLVFDRVDGPSMMSELAERPERVSDSAQRLARWHHQMHTRQAPASLPAQRQVIGRRVDAARALSDGERGSAREALAQAPDSDRFCHGDFHPGNVLLTPDGPVIIDWMDASRGHPPIDVARSLLLFLGHIETSRVPPAVKAAMEHYYRTYLAHYVELSAADESACTRWLPILAAARLAEDIPEQRDWLLRQARAMPGWRRGVGAPPPV